MSLLRYPLSLVCALAVTLPILADHVRGLITRIDLKKNEIVIEGLGPNRGQQIRLQVGPQTQVMLGGEQAQLADLAIGKRARVVFQQEEGRPVAQLIRVVDLGRVIGKLAESAGNPARTSPALPPSSPPPDRPAPVPGSSDASTFTGTLQRIGVTDRELVLIGPGSNGPRTETTITVPEKVEIRKGDQPVSLDGLKEGETVTIKTEKHRGRLTAVSVKVGASASTQPAAGRRESSAVPLPSPAVPYPPRPLPRIRGALQALDQVLQQIEQQQRDLEQQAERAR